MRKNYWNITESSFLEYFFSNLMKTSCLVGVDVTINRTQPDLTYPKPPIFSNIHALLGLIQISTERSTPSFFGASELLSLKNVSIDSWQSKHARFINITQCARENVKIHELPHVVHVKNVTKIEKSFLVSSVIKFECVVSTNKPWENFDYCVFENSHIELSVTFIFSQYCSVLLINHRYIFVLFVLLSSIIV